MRSRLNRFPLIGIGFEDPPEVCIIGIDGGDNGRESEYSLPSRELLSFASSFAAAPPLISIALLREWLAVEASELRLDVLQTFDWSPR